MDSLDSSILLMAIIAILLPFFSVVAHNQFVQTTLLSVIYKLYLFCYHSLLGYASITKDKLAALSSQRSSAIISLWVSLTESSVMSVIFHWRGRLSLVFLSLKVVITEKTLNRVTLTPRIRTRRAYQLYLCEVLVKVWVGLFVLQRQLFFSCTSHTIYTHNPCRAIQILRVKQHFEDF